MCDCYNHPCKVCGLKLPIHLSDFDTERDEIEVFCDRHIPPKNVNVTIYICTKETYSSDAENGEYWPKGYRMGIKSLTENAKNNRIGNHPNESNFAVWEGR